MGLEALVLEPVLQASGLGAGLGEELAFVEGAEGGGEQFAQPVGGGLFAVDGGQTDDAVRIGEGFEAVGTQRRAIGEGGAGLAGPAVAQQPGDGDLEGGVRVFGMPIEEPLGRVARIRLGQPLGVFLRGDFLPVLQVEGDFQQSLVCDRKTLI